MARLFDSTGLIGLKLRKVEICAADAGAVKETGHISDITCTGMC